MSKQGAIWITWGDACKTQVERSMASFAKQYPTMETLHIRLGDDATMLDKAKMYELSPFDLTLFLDADTVVMGDLSLGWRKADQFGLAVCVNECPWAWRYPSIKGDVVEYNTGVIFFSKSAGGVFRAWRKVVDQIDSSIDWTRADGQAMRMPCNDQAGFAAAVEQVRANPFVLPMNYNYRPHFQLSFMGPVKIWHDYREPPEAIATATDPNTTYKVDGWTAAA